MRAVKLNNELKDVKCYELGVLGNCKEANHIHTTTSGQHMKAHFHT